jgi:hypothetical protein
VASNLTGQEFYGRLDYYANAWLPARDIVAESVASREVVDPSGRVLLFERSVPWKVSSVIYLARFVAFVD